MNDLYSIKDTAKLFDLRPAQLRYWTQTGFVAPTVRRNGRHFYTFRDLVTVKAAKELLESGLTIHTARPSVEVLREKLPKRLGPKSALRVRGDGDRINVVDDQDALQQSPEVVVSFKIAALADHIASVLAGRPVPLPEPEQAESEAQTTSPDDESVPVSVPEVSTVRHKQPSAYQCFLEGFSAEERGEGDVAELWYRRALQEEAALAAAHTNLGNVLYARGKQEEAKACYEKALNHDPDQPEARFNLGNLLDDLGESDRAIAELRQVVARQPDFADAHFNLGVILARVGGVAQARKHLQTYIELDGASEWADRAKSLVAELP
jgi:tetratricopeptide (TPR) repeat protein